MTIWTERLIIVISPSMQAQADAIAKVADPTTSGTTFTARLCRVGDATEATAAYWTLWVMTPEQESRLVAEFGSRVGTVTILARGDTPKANAKYWLFDATEGTGWTPDEVLTALNLTPPQTADWD